MGAGSGMEVFREENGMDKVSDTLEHLKNINTEYWFNQKILGGKRRKDIIELNPHQESTDNL